MSLIMFEGWETHETLSDLTVHGPTLNNTQVLLTSIDGNSVGPRGSGYGCWKGTSTGAVSAGLSSYPSDVIARTRHNNLWPRVLLTPPSYQTQPTDASGIFGFAFYPKLTGNQAWSDGEAFFTPLACVCDVSGSPHFFIGTNSSLTLLVYRWNNTLPASLWNSNWIANNYDNYGTFDSNSTPWTYNTNQGTWQSVPGYRYTVPDPAKFTLIGSGGILANDEWNYIECKTGIRNNISGSLQLKLNRTVSDNTLDINVTGVQTTSKTNNIIGGIALGQFLGYRTSLSTGFNCNGLGSIGMVSYYDDFYWCDSTPTSGNNAFNNFLGPIFVRSTQVTSIVSRTMPTVSGVSDLSAISGRFSSGSLASFVQSNDKGQGITFKVAQPPQSGIIAASLLSAGYETAAPTAQFHVTASFSGGTVTTEHPTIVNTNRGFSLMLPNAPDNTSWTPEKLAATNFLLEHR